MSVVLRSAPYRISAQSCLIDIRPAFSAGGFRVDPTFVHDPFEVYHLATYLSESYSINELKLLDKNSSNHAKASFHVPLLRASPTTPTGHSSVTLIHEILSLIEVVAGGALPSPVRPGHSEHYSVVRSPSTVTMLQRTRPILCILPASRVSSQVNGFNCRVRYDI